MTWLITTALLSFITLCPAWVSATDAAVAHTHLSNGHYTEAYREFRGLAEAGYADYQISLAKLHSSGSGVPKDFVQAYAWYALAAAQGNSEGKSGMERMAEQMTDTQLIESREQAREFAQRYLAPVRPEGSWRLEF